METGHPSTRAVNSGSGNRAYGMEQSLRNITSTAKFKRHFKTHLFNNILITFVILYITS